MGPSGLFRPSLQPYKYDTVIHTRPNRRHACLQCGRVAPGRTHLATPVTARLTRRMRITKYEHAGLRIDAEGRSLLIDPGGFTTLPDDLATVVAIVITHEHPDHLDPENIARVRAAAPGIPVFGPSGVAQAAPDAGITTVAPGETVDVAGFTLRFFGGEHAVIHRSIPLIQNLGVLIDDELYYPGDSYAVPDGIEMQTLAAPLGAPWLKIGEAMDFVLAARPRRAFGTHDMTLSDVGRAMHRDRLRWATAQHGGEFFDLDPGDVLEV